VSPVAGASLSALLVGLGFVAAGRVATFGAGRAAAVAGRRRLGDAWSVGRDRTARRWLARRARAAAQHGPVTRWIDARRRRRRDALLADFVDAVVRSVRAGSSVGVALHDGAEVVGEPFVDEIGGVERQVSLGVPWDEALDGWATRSGSDDIRLLVTACSLGGRLGRGTASALDGVARTLADRRDVSAEARAAASQARASAAMLILLPVAFTAVMAVADPHTVSVLVGTPVGLGCLVAATVLDALGALWMRRMIATGR
jgi:tight adherence protein B